MYKKIIFNEPEFNRNPSLQIAPEAKDLIIKLLEKNPKKRPKILGVKEHPFFKDVNYQDIIELKIEPPFKPDTSSEFKFIDPILNGEKPDDSINIGLSPLIVKGIISYYKDFAEFTYANNYVAK